MIEVPGCNSVTAGEVKKFFSAVCPAKLMVTAGLFSAGLPVPPSLCPCCTGPAVLVEVPARAMPASKPTDAMVAIAAEKITDLD